jgi:hypothetical protein
MGVKLGLLPLKEEYRLTLFENKLLKRVFGPRRGNNRMLESIHNGGHHNSCFSPNIIRVVK